MLQSLISAIVNSKLSLVWKLRIFRALAIFGWRKSRLENWANLHPKIVTGSNWHSKAWWGVVAGCTVKNYLSDSSLRAEAFALLEPTDWSELDSALAQGSVIVATAHIGPPKFLMNIMIERQMPLLVWTNMNDMPEWLSKSTTTNFLDPLLAAERGALLVKSALHLRRGGILFGAADMQTSDRSIELYDFDTTWHLSPGLPALAFKLNVPTFFGLALWVGNRIRITYKRLEISQEGMTDEEWQEAWFRQYWSEIAKLIPSSPENLRFLRNIDDGNFSRELGFKI